jgi:peptidase E
MSIFYLPVGDKSYKMEYTRDSARLFESIGCSIQEMQTKIFLSIDGLMFVGLSTHNRAMNLNLSKKIADEAIAEWGPSELYEKLSERFAEVFMNAGKSAKKLKLLDAPMNKVAKTEETEE